MKFGSSDARHLCTRGWPLLVITMRIRTSSANAPANRLIAIRSSFRQFEPIVAHRYCRQVKPPTRCGDRASGRSWTLEFRVDAAAVDPGDQATERERQSRVDENGSAERRETCNRLTAESVGLTGVRETQRRSQAASRAQALEI